MPTLLLAGLEVEDDEPVLDDAQQIDRAAVAVLGIEENLFDEQRRDAIAIDRELARQDESRPSRCAVEGIPAQPALQEQSARSVHPMPSVRQLLAAVLEARIARRAVGEETVIGPTFIAQNLRH